MTFDNRHLRDLLIEAVRYGNDPEVRAGCGRWWTIPWTARNCRSFWEERALTEDTMDIHRIMAIREDMERIEAHKLQRILLKPFL